MTTKSTIKGSKKKSMGSIRAKAGLPPKAGRNRPPHLRSERDRNGKRQWFTTNKE